MVKVVELTQLQISCLVLYIVLRIVNDSVRNILKSADKAPKFRSRERKQPLLGENRSHPAGARETAANCCIGLRKKGQATVHGEDGIK